MSNGSDAVLYVSPHADDVAFSAAAQLAREVASGARAVVMTLFEPPEPGDVRRGEDEAFAKAFGVELARGAWPDAIVRRRRYRSPAQLFAPLRADEAPLVEAVRAALQARVDGGCRRVVAPLGVGGHVDHQVAHAACRALVGAEVSFYEDTPYVLTPFQLPRRLARLDAAAEAATEGDATLVRGSVRAELGAAANSWLAAPLIQERVGPRLRKLAVAAILTPEWTRWPRRSRARTRRFLPSLIAGDEVARHKLEAVAAYPTQWRLFYPTLDDWRAALERYARAMGQPAVVERVWREVDPRYGVARPAAP